MKSPSVHRLGLCVVWLLVSCGVPSWAIPQVGLQNNCGRVFLRHFNLTSQRRRFQLPPRFKTGGVG